MSLMAIAYFVSVSSGAMSSLMLAPAVFAFGLVAFGFLGMGPVTIAVDSYGPVTDNAQSVYELSLIEQVPVAEIKREFNIDVNFERAKHLLEENDGAGNTFKATAKPVLIGTAVVGATTMIFSIIVALTGGLKHNVEKLSLLYPPFLLGLVTGGAVIYWFTGASDNAKKTVEVELKAKGTPLHAATVVGDTVGDPFKDTSSVAMNPVIKFTTLFGLLAVELAVQLTRDVGSGVSHLLAAAFFVL